MLGYHKQTKFKKKKTKDLMETKEAIHQKWIGGFLINDVPKEKLSFKKISKKRMYPKSWKYLRKEGNIIKRHEEVMKIIEYSL